LTKYISITRAAILAGVLSAAALALVPAAGGAVCPPGTTNPAYCSSVPPTATTRAATSVGSTSATLNGTVRPNGAVTQYYFQYGATAAVYGSQTATATVGSCAPGQTSGPYCSVPRTQRVLATITGLTPGQTYHYRLVATRSGLTAYGRDRAFTTHRVNPIKSVTSPARVTHGTSFTVGVTLNLRSSVAIMLLQGNSVITFYTEGLQTGTVTQSITAPTRTGRYTVRVEAIATGVNPQVINRRLTVF